MAALLSMRLQVCRDYAGIPDYRTLDAYELKSLYDALRGELLGSQRGPKSIRDLR